MLPPPLPVRHSPWLVRALAIVLGLIYGISMRLIFAPKGYGGVFRMMSISFLFAVPLGIGFLHTYLGESAGRWSWPQRLFTPIIPAILCLLAALALAWEGIICIFLWAPIVVVMSIVGGCCAGLARDALSTRGRHFTFAFSLILPLILSPAENRIPPERQIRTVANTIEIDASPDIVWDNVKSVPTIRPEELTPSWTRRIGFPRPLAATLSYDGIGGVRRATFEGGVLFEETVDVWEPRRRIAFSIAADNIPAATLDEHVTVGGPYFDVLEGEYRMEQLAPGRILLHLSSRHRLSTHFNGYASLWTDSIMSDLQKTILEVLKRRCERR